MILRRYQYRDHQQATDRTAKQKNWSDDDFLLPFQMKESHVVGYRGAAKEGTRSYSQTRTVCLCKCVVNEWRYNLGKMHLGNEDSSHTFLFERSFR